MSKRYYYIKLPENFYDREEMKILESRENGYIYSNIYMKMILLSLKYDGKLAFKGYLPYDIKTLATVLNHDIDNVKGAIEILKKLGMIEILSDNTIYMLDIQELIGSITDEAKRKREYRQRIEKEKKEKKTKQIENKNKNKDNFGTMSGQSPDILELEKEKEKEKEIELDKDLKLDKNNIYSPSDASNNDNNLQDIDNPLNDNGVENGEYIVGQNPTNKRKRRNNDIEKKGYIVLKYLNIKAERNFQKIHRYIKARLKEYHLNDLLDVIDYKCYEWKDNPEMKKYLRPETLFAPTHFDTYLDEAKRELFEMEYSKWLDEWMAEQRRKGAQQITYLPKRDYFEEEIYVKIRQKQISNILTSGGR